MTDATEAATVRALVAARSLTREQADELLTHLPVVDDLATQRLLDAWVEQAADTLRALSEAAEERLLELARHAPEPSRPPEPSRARGGVSGSTRPGAWP
jgi:hypothetical protein